MAMSLNLHTLTPLFHVAWKVALTLTAVKCAHIIFRALASGRLRITQVVSRRNAQLRAQLDEACQTTRTLRERLREETAQVQLVMELASEEVEFWRRMEGLARRELWRQADALRRAEAALEAQTVRVQLLDAELQESTLLAQGRQRHLADERASLQELLGASRAALPEAQPWAGPGDAQSDADVVQMVRSLNLEITRAATVLTNAFHVEDDGRSGEDFADASERTKTAVGPVMAELLESIQHEEDPILVHVAMQADMVSFAAGIVSAWDFQHQSDATFSSIHKQMLKSESQAVTGRWRSLTRQYSKQRLYNGRDLAEGFTAQLAERLADILLVAGASPAAVRTPSTQQSLETVVRSALALQEAVGEGITSHDLEVVLVRMDEVFDSSRMEDVYSDGGEGAAGAHVERGGGELEDERLHVLCTAALGLRRCEKPREGLGDELQVSVLVKPKVVLETFVYELGLLEEEEMEMSSDDAGGHGEP